MLCIQHSTEGKSPIEKRKLKSKKTLGKHYKQNEAMVIIFLLVVREAQCVSKI